MTHDTNSDGQDGTRSPAVDGHRARVIGAETRRLERRLREYGPMPRERLAQACGAERWREGTFEEAVIEGLRTGRLRELPLGWIEAPLSGDAPAA
jgi:hypothetical protein